MISIATPQLSIMEQAPSTDLATENMHLRWRVSMLENIVKQAAAYFSSNTPIDMATAPPPHPMMEVHTPSPPRIAGMDATLSPPLFPTLREPVQSPLRLQTKLDTTNNMTHPDTNQSTASADVVSSFIDLSTPVARHPAVVATLPAVSSERRGVALQRATESLTAINLDLPANRQRLATVARVIVALARLRGWTSASQARSARTAAQLKTSARRRTPGSLRALRRTSGTRR